MVVSTDCRLSIITGYIVRFISHQPYFATKFDYALILYKPDNKKKDVMLQCIYMYLAE